MDKPALVHQRPSLACPCHFDDEKAASYCPAKGGTFGVHPSPSNGTVPLPLPEIKAAKQEVNFDIFGPAAFFKI